MVSKFLGCKLVYDAHELESQKNGQTPFLSKGTLILEKFCWNRIDLLISVSDSILRWYHEKLGYVRSILVLNAPVQYTDESNGISMYQSGNYFHQKYALPDQAVIFVYLGILVKGRCIESYLTAFSSDRLRDAHLIFVGYGDLDALIRVYADSHCNIHLHSPVPHGEVVGIVKNADYGLCFIENISLSDYFCLPNKLFEYAFAGLDVLASDFPEIQKIVNQYSLGICCSPDSYSIVKAVEEALLRQPSDRFRDISQLSWSAQADRLRASYIELLKTA
jgi:glycosyltransferase involved in cell wall biosynthesis